MLATIALAALAVLLGALLYRRSRELDGVRAVTNRLDVVARTGDLTERLAPHAGEGSAVEVAASIDRLIERVHSDSSALAERETVYRRLLETMHEAMLVEREGIVIANARFAEMVGAESPAQLAGRRLVDLVHPDFASLVAGNLKRHVAGETAPPRLEAELRTADGRPHRVEFAFTRINYEGQPAVLVAAVEIEPRVAAAPAARSHANAWGALDSLAEGVLTTDVEGRIVYVNEAGCHLIGKQMAE